MAVFSRENLKPSFTPARAVTLREFNPPSLPAIRGVERIDTPRGRFYSTPDGNRYPSVTTVLSVMPKPELDSWRAAVGEVEASRVSKRATEFGSAIHDLAERYVLGRLDPNERLRDKRTETAFKSAASFLSGVREVLACEAKLYSDGLAVAGTCDGVMDFGDGPCVIDYKTSSGVKYASGIRGYILQAAAYAEMIRERHGIACGRARIVIITLDDEVPNVIDVDITPTLLGELREVVNAYYNSIGGRRAVADGDAVLGATER